LEKAYLQVNRRIPEEIEAFLRTQIAPGETTYSQATFQHYLVDNLTDTQITEYEKSLSTSRGQFNKSEEFDVSENARCSQVFAKLGSNATNLAISEIERRDWHGAYTIINARYLEKGIGDIVIFETEARSIRMQPGQPLQDHIARLQESLKQWSSVMYVSAESIRNQGQMHLIQINVEQSTANAGLATDQEIRDMGFQVFINEETRYDIYERSVEDMKRFESILDRFSLKDRHEKSVRLFLKALENKEKSSQGQRAFREELILHPNHSSSGNPNKKRIALATTPSTASNQIVADQVCKYHPGRLVRHSEKDCNLNPSNANTKQKAGAKKDPCCSW
jgi:hypothetical protein